MSVRTVFVYKAADGWRWRLKSRNGRILADSGEAYVKRGGAVKGASTAFDWPSYRLRVEGVPGWSVIG